MGVYIATGLDKIGASLVRLAVFEGPFSMQRSTHKHTHIHNTSVTKDKSYF